jgi:multicomponent K+:H+ antiporter subunit E
MTRWLPYPRLSAALLALWLLLNQSVGASHIALGVVLGFLAPLVMANLEVPRAGWRRPGAVVRLACWVFADIVRSNIAVAKIILRPGPLCHTSGFVTIPLELRSPNGLAALACIITATPGTIWVRLDSAEGLLVIHVLDVIDENTWIQTIKNRYERLLMEIFE